MTRFLQTFAFIVCIAGLYVLAAEHLVAQNLSVADPRGNWNRRGQGRIEEALLTITPCGIYAECNLFLTFSSRGTTLTSVRDSLEIQMDFQLPPEAHITDSWLWVGDSIVQAKIFDRTSASRVYEAIVQRRQDPSLLTKYAAGYFNLRVFPMRGNETRKVKISYLVPTEWTRTSVRAPLPVNILKSSSLVPHLNILYYPHKDWSTPRLTTERTNGVILTLDNSLRQTTELQTGRAVFTTVLTNAEARNASASYIVWNSPAQNGVFMQTFSRSPISTTNVPAGQTEQFYHIAVAVRQALGASEQDSVEIDNMRLTQGGVAATERYLMHIPPVNSSGYYPDIWGAPNIRPALGILPYPSPTYTFRGTQRIDKNGVIHEVGRLTNTKPEFSNDALRVHIGGFVNNVPFGIERSIAANTVQEGALCTCTSWLGNHLNALEQEPVRFISNGRDTAAELRQRYIIQQSVANRVLTRLTAFLALEPDDTTRVCATCTAPETGSPAAARDAAAPAPNAQCH